jgi:ABC-type multidrug transport system fused ATPase/permease subunit
LQQPSLFSGTITENLRFGACDGDGTLDVVTAARAAEAAAFIEDRPDGYGGEVKRRGANFSGGQRQRLSIARIILANGPVLILDEATSSVDTRTEKKLQEALTTMMRGRTSLVIAHRLSTIRDSDVIVAIADGRVVDVGSHDELMASDGFYHDLYMSRFRGDARPAAPLT